MKPIKLLVRNAPVFDLQDELATHPDIWDRRKQRTAQYVHGDVSDIWVRYNELGLTNPSAALADMQTAHESVWYPESELIPSARKLALQIMGFVQGERLGGILITRVPAGTEVKPHSDHSWHADYYDKFAIQVHGHSQQAFCFEDASLVTLPGDIYTFDNSKVHWVTNESPEDRVTMIICIKTNYKPVRVR